jgi:hypothetical protein
VPRELPDEPSAAPVTYIEGAHAMPVRGDPAGRVLPAEARDRFRAAGQGGDAHRATMLWAMTEAFFGTRASASSARDVYVAEADASGAEWARTWAQWCSGLVELRHGEAHRALAPLQRALARQQAIGDSWGPVWGLETPAWAVAATGDGTRAAWLRGVRGGLVPAASAEDAPGPVPEEGTSQARSTRTRTGGSRTPTA